MCKYFWLKKKKKKFTLHCAIDRTLYVQSQTQACVQTHLRLFERRDPLHKHTLSMNAIERTYVRLIACILNQHVTLFKSPSSFSPSFLHCAVQSLSLFPSSHITPNHHPTTQTPPHHHHSTSAPPPTTTAGRPITPFLYFSIFVPIFSQTQLSQIPQFVSVFERPKAQSILELCPFCFSLLILTFAGGWVRILNGF